MIEQYYNDDGRQYLQMMQDIISRLASNSANCKTWLVTLVTSLLAIGTSIESLNGWLFLTFLPIIVFGSMDTYYLKLERGMRNREHLFINIVTAKEFDENAYKRTLFNFEPYDSITNNDELGIVETEKVEWSNSIFPFYGVTLALAFVVTVITLLTH